MQKNSMQDSKKIHVDPIARISSATLSFLIIGVSSTALSAIFHSRYHTISILFFFAALLFSCFAFVQLINSIADKLPRPLEIFLHWVHAMVFELFAYISLFFIPFFRAQGPFGAKVGTPVLLVHGYRNDGSVWIYLQKKITKSGIGPVYTIDLGSSKHSLRDFAKKLAEKAGTIREETGRHDLILIGHSMGGLVSALYATDYAPPGTVTDVITIGSPMAGTHVARLAVGTSAREMQRGSELIARLNRNIKEERCVRFYHIGTATDQLVIPSQSALVGTNPTREFLLKDIGHISLLFSPRVGTIISNWLLPH